MPARWLILVLSTLATLLPASASACSCNPSEPIASLIERSDAVFRGRVLSVESPGMFDSDKWPKGEWIVRFEVATAWKGPAEAELVVTTNKGATACGITFKKGTEYLVFASLRSPNTPLWTSECHRTDEIRPTSADLQYIEAHLSPLPLKPKRPAASSCSATSASHSWLALLLLSALLRRTRGPSRAGRGLQNQTSESQQVLEHGDVWHQPAARCARQPQGR